MTKTWFGVMREIETHGDTRYSLTVPRRDAYAAPYESMGDLDFCDGVM